jgi:hypothetical protein
VKARFVICAFVGACSFNADVSDPNAVGDADTDSPPMLDAYFPDAPLSCPSVTPPMCVAGANVLRECKVIGDPAVDLSCAWGCVQGTPHHCGKLVPSGGGVTIADLETGGVGEKTITVSGNNVIFDTVTGEITGGVRPAGVGNVANGIEFKISNNVGVWRFGKLILQTFDNSDVRVRGTNAMALVSLTTVDVERVVLDLRGECGATNAVAGGKPGGVEETAGTMGGAGGVQFGGNDASGGAGGGYGKAGGNGGRPDGQSAPTGGPAFGNPQIVTLTGGGGGGGGGGKGTAGVGGGGGGAVQIVANGSVRLRGFLIRRAGINAGGCGGKGGTGMDAGGGGGAGGAVLIEAPQITLDIAGIAVNGGGGGGGHTGGPGEPGGFGTARAAGGTAVNGGGPGAGGGASGSTNMTGAAGATNDHAGGGGGGVGWIRLNTLNGAVSMVNASFVSPSFNDTASTASRGMPIIQ